MRNRPIKHDVVHKIRLVMEKAVDVKIGSTVQWYTLHTDFSHDWENENLP